MYRVQSPSKDWGILSGQQKLQFSMGHHPGHSPKMAAMPGANRPHICFKVLVLCVFMSVVTSGKGVSRHFHASYEQRPEARLRNLILGTEHEYHIDTEQLHASMYYMNHQFYPGKQHPPLYPCRSSWLVALFLITSGDVECNPGPYKPKYPCQICSKAVKWGQKGIQCDQCDGWYQADCIHMSTCIYEAQRPDVSWICCTCGLPNFSSTLFQTSLMSHLTNSYASLDTTVASTEGLPASPLATSSPKPNIPKEKPHHKKNKLRVLVVNFQGMRSKQEVIQEMLMSTDPDIVLGTETHLDEDVNIREILPDNYTQVQRRDRGSRKGGGVIIFSREDIELQPLDNITSESSETTWAEVLNAGKKVIIGVHYRPPKSSIEVISDLENLLPQVRQRSKEAVIILGGDFNLPGINWDQLTTQAGAPDTAHCNKLLDITQAHTLEQMVKEPTRGSNILDLCFTSAPGLVEKCTTGPGISDHDHIVILDTKLHTNPNKKKPWKKHLFNKADWTQINKDITWLNEKFLNSHPERKPVEQNWNFIREDLQKTIQLRIPTKTVRGKKDLPWLTREGKQLIRRRNRAHAKAKRSRSGRDWDHFRELRRKAQKSLRKSYHDYIGKILDPEEDTGGKRLWSFLKARRQEHSGVATLKSATGLVRSSRDKAQVLNNQFSSVFTNEDTQNLPTMGVSPHPTMPDIVVNQDGVTKLLQRLKPQKAAGPDELPARFLKECALSLSPLLTFIFQQSLDQGFVPTDWRKANVTPIFKKGDRGLPSNYRPVSLTSIICKTMEHIVVSQVMDHADLHGILVDNQHGFRAKRSCESQLIITTHDLAEIINRKSQADLAILDFSKAFDKVPHKRLLAKLDYYGLRGQTNQWFTSFLTDRSQRVLVDGESSDERPVTSGVPQGSVVGPVLFLLFINDIANNLDCRVRLFADDCLVYREIQTPEDSLKLQTDLNSLIEWSADWQMAFNVDKCFIMRVTLNRRNVVSHQYTMAGANLKMVDSQPYLGVHLHSKLSWDVHLNHVTAKAKRALGFVRRNLRHCHPDTKKRAYIALVRPLVEYCSVVWDPHHQNKINKVEGIQRAAARFVAGKPHRRNDDTSVTQILRELGWETLQARRRKAKVTFLYKMVNNLVAIPEEYHPQPKPSSGTRRANSRQFLQVHASNQVYQNAFLPSVIPLWNQLPESLAQAESIESFKAGLKDVQL